MATSTVPLSHLVRPPPTTPPLSPSSPSASPSTSTRSSPRSSAPDPHPPPSPPPETCAMLLAWFRNATPNILQATGHRPRRQKAENPTIALAYLLNDGLVLAHLLAFLDPIRLPVSTITHGAPRNALSLPVPVPQHQEGNDVNAQPDNIDARQLFMQYKNNTRRVTAAVKKVLDDVRAYSGFPHRPPPGAIDAFLGNVASIQPTVDLRPAARLAQLVVAAAVYGRRHTEFRHSIWRFRDDVTRTAFHVAMTAVSQAVALPPPDVLYAAGPPPPAPRHIAPSPPVGGVLATTGGVTGQVRGRSPKPPPSPVQSTQNVGALSPRAAHIPNPVLSPNAVLSPAGASPRGKVLSPGRQARAPSPRMSPGRTSPSGRVSRSGSSTPPQYASPRQHVSHYQGVSPPPPPLKGRTQGRGSPRLTQSPVRARSPNVHSPRQHSNKSSPRMSEAANPAAGRSPQRAAARSSARSSASPRTSGRNTPRQSGSSPLARSVVPDAKAAPVGEGVQCMSRSQMMEDVIGGRKFSMITDDESRSRSISPQEASSGNSQLGQHDGGSSGELPSLPIPGETYGVNPEIVQSMRALEQAHRRGERQLEHISSRVEEASAENEPISKRSSDEFYTPNDESPCPSPLPRSSEQMPLPVEQTREMSDPTPSDEFLPSPPMSGMYKDETANKYYQDTKVDEKVRQSVATSITEQISQGTAFRNSGQGSEDAEKEKQAAPRLFRNDSNPSSIDMRDQSYLLSPSASDAPSPSNQWQVSHQKGVGQDILSPLPMFSPPTMPPRLSRSTMSTQMTPPGALPGAPLFRSGTDSPQLSMSSADTQSMTDLMQKARKRQQGDHENNDTSKSTGQNRSASLPPRHPFSSRVAPASSNNSAQHGSQSVPTIAQTQMAGGKSRVSFAPTIISPGGHMRPLGKPLKGSEGEVERPLSTDSTTSTASFSLPPSAAEDARVAQGRREVVGHDIGSKETSYCTQEPTHEPAADVTQEGREAGIQTDDMEDSDGTEHGRLVENSSSFLAKTTFEHVQEYVVYNSDESEEKKSPDAEEEMENEDGDDGLDVGKGRVEEHGDEAEFDDDEEYVDEEVVNGSSDLSEEGDKRVDEPSAEEDMEGTNRLPEVPDVSAAPHMLTGMDMAASGQTEQGEARTLGQLAGYVPSAADFITPPTAVRYSRRARVNPLDVPMTPPSPPDIGSLMVSISNSKLPGLPEASEEEDDDEDGPVSTMEPSMGLFQKLIAVWQSADEQGVRPESLRADMEGQGASNMYVPEVSTPLSSAPESSLRSPETAEGDKVVADTAAAESSSRSRRPRAMRLPPGAMSPSAMGGADSSGGDKREEAGEGTSMASFSDAFSSDDKDPAWPENGRSNSEGGEWEEALKGDTRAGLPLSPREGVEVGMVPGSDMKSMEEEVAAVSGETSREALRRAKRRVDYSTSQGVSTDGHHVKVDRRRLDWLTRELLKARDAIARKELQMTFAETQRLEQEEILLLERQDAESVVEAMKKILTEREGELHNARERLSVAIQSGPVGETSTTVGTREVGGMGGAPIDGSGGSGGGAVSGGAAGERVSVESRSSSAGANLEKLIVEGHAKLHGRFDECGAKHVEANKALGGEMKALWNEVQRAMVEKMSEMTEKRDAELEVLRKELSNRERLISDLKMSSNELADQNRAMQEEASELRVEKEKTAHRYELEMAHVTAQVELVNEFSKKLHDNFRETENLRQQVLQYQDKLSHITSASGVSQRQIKELREAVTRANDECARLRREAEMAKKKGMEAVRRAEELEELRYKDAAAQTAGRYPDRQDSGSFRSHEPVRPAGHNRPGGSGVNARYHGTTRSRALPSGPTPAQKAWLVIKDKLSGMVPGKEGAAARRRGTERGMREGGRSGGLSGAGSVSSRSGRSRGSRDDDGGSVRSRSMSRSSGGGSERSGGSVGGGGGVDGGSRGGSVSGSSVRSGGQRSNGVGSDGSEGGGHYLHHHLAEGGREGVEGGGNIDDASAGYMDRGPYGGGAVGRIRATDF